jgi:hypothetical protein
MDSVVVAVISSALGSAGLFSLVQFLITRKDKKEEDRCQYSAQLNRIEKRTVENEKAIVRLQLIYLIHEQPHNRDTILKTAQRYFIELDGNGEAWAVFDTWAKKTNLDLGWYKMLLDRKEKKDAEHN